jgi:hypothetical protein
MASRRRPRSTSSKIGLDVAPLTARSACARVRGSTELILRRMSPTSTPACAARLSGSTAWIRNAAVGDSRTTPRPASVAVNTPGVPALVSNVIV